MEKKRVTVFSSDQNQEAPIFVALNGRQMYVPQGVEVEMDEGLIQVLQSAVERLPGSDNSKDVVMPRFHVTVHGDSERVAKNIESVEAKRPPANLK